VDYSDRVLPLLQIKCMPMSSKIASFRGRDPALPNTVWAYMQGRRRGFKLGGQNVIRERSERKKICTPTFGKVGKYNFLHVGGTSKEISIIIKYS